jgi:thioredoxin family protein
LPWPVALDNKMATWHAYRNRYWPHVYLIDRTGRIRFDHIGEGGDALIQDRLRGLLAGEGVSLPEGIDFTEASFDPDLTPEIYAGFERGAVAASIGNPVGYRPNQDVDYTPVDPSSIHDAGTDGSFFLEGRWRARAEYLEAVEDGARLVLPFFARDVFFVAAPSAAGPVSVRLMLDGTAVPAETLGADAPGGVVRVTRSDLYRLVRLGASNTHELSMEVDAGFRLYTFTFG